MVSFSCAAKYEQLLREEKQRKNSSRDTYSQDQNVEANALDPDAYLSDSDSEIFERNVAELIAGKPTTCKALAKTDSKSSDRISLQPRLFKDSIEILI